MQAGGIKTRSLPVTEVDVVTATMTKLSANKDRIHFYVRREATDFHIAYQELAPTDTTTMMLIDSTVAGDFFDGALVPTCNIWVYHAKGTNLLIHYREGVQG